MVQLPWSDVFVSEGNLGLLDNGEIPIQTADWSNGLVAVMSTGAIICTGINTGYVRVSSTSQLQPPEELDTHKLWEEIVEVSVRAPLGELQVASLEMGLAEGQPILGFPNAVTYRLRVHARGREGDFGGVQMKPVEDYLLQVWPGELMDPIIIRSSERINHRLRTHSNEEVEPVAPSVDEEEQTRERLRQALLRSRDSPL